MQTAEKEAGGVIPCVLVYLELINVSYYFYVWSIFHKLPWSFYRPGGRTNQSQAFYEHININTTTEVWINTALLPADTSDFTLCCN